MIPFAEARTIRDDFDDRYLPVTNFQSPVRAALNGSDRDTLHMKSEPSEKDWQTITDLARTMTRCALRRNECKASVAEIAERYNAEYRDSLTAHDVRKLLTRARVFKITHGRDAANQLVTFNGFAPHSFEAVQKQMVQELTSRGSSAPRKAK